MENLKSVKPVWPVYTKFDKRNKNKLLRKKKLIKKKLTKFEQLIFLTYGADGKINNPEKIGSIINLSL